MTCIVQRHNYRLRDLVRSSGNTNYATELGVPRSTAHGWLTSNPVKIVTVDVVDMDLLSLQKEVLTLRKRIKWTVALFRLVRLHQWRRPRRRIHPAKPKVGIRAIIPNEIWHVDTTLIRLLDGSRAYLHVVIENFSRRILSWKVYGTFDPGFAADLLLDASKGLLNQQPTLLADGGVDCHDCEHQRVAKATSVSWANMALGSFENLHSSPKAI